MNDQSDSQLLRAYAESRSEAAFAELVRRHLDLVYSASLRMVCDSHLAEDVTQGVFVALTKNAAVLVNRTVLSGWLHRTAQNIAAQTVRTIERRRARELEAATMNELLAAEPDISWEHIAPHLDAALGELSEPDRDAVLLRYFERKSALEMARILGISDDAAQKRVSRAVERLREFFVKRGITVGASGLTVAISAKAVQAAPVGLAVSISTAAVAGITNATLGTSTTIAGMNMINAKTAALMAASAILAGTGTHFVQQQTANGLRAENQRLAVQLDALTADRDAALSSAATSANEVEQLQKDRTDLLRLRNEVGMLRRQTNELHRLRQENRQLQSLLAEAQSAETAEAGSHDDPERQAAIAKMNDSRLLGLGLLLYAADNADKFPDNLEQTAGYLTNADWKLTGTNEFDLLAQGLITGITNPMTTIIIREKEASVVNGVRFKTYVFADGHSEYKREPPEGFKAWEKEHMCVSPSP